jgi:hypothetical protein
MEITPVVLYVVLYVFTRRFTDGDVLLAEVPLGFVPVTVKQELMLYTFEIGRAHV